MIFHHSELSVRCMLLSCFIMLAALQSSEAFAQTINTYTNTDIVANNIDGTRTCPSAPLIRAFTVSDNFTVLDVDIGVIATHSWRGDMRMTLESPDGTRVQLTNGDVTIGGAADNFNATINDEGTDGVVNVNNIDHNVALPPYQFDLIPNNSLSAFDGENSNGIWRLEICDLFPGADNGNFLRADLFLTEPLSLDVTKASTLITDPVSGTSNPKAIPGAVVEYCVTISNPNNITVTLITAVDNLPANATFVSGSLRSGSDCASATTIEDDDAIGIDESDPVGAAFSGSTVTVAGPILASSQSLALTFRVIVD